MEGGKEDYKKSLFSLMIYLQAFYHPIRSSNHGHSFAHRVVKLSGNSKIGQFNLSIVVQKDISGFHIPVNFSD